MKIIKLISSLLAAALLVTTVPVTTQAEVTYEEKDSGTNIGQSFTGSATVTFGQTPSFTIKIPKTITLDDAGAGKYTVGVKGQIPSKYAVSVVPDKTIVMEEENGLLDNITADVTAGKTEWTAAELDPDSYAENTENTIQMQSIDYGKFEGTLNFNVLVAVSKVELKDASDEVKAANNFYGSYSYSSLTAVNTPYAGIRCRYNTDTYETEKISVGDIIYISGGTATVSGYSVNVTGGYYKALSVAIDGLPLVNIFDNSSIATEYCEYLGKSYIV